MKKTGTGLLAGALLHSCAALLLAGTLPVTTTADAGPGSLRQAILNSNASPGMLDTITFAIPGSGVQTITLQSPLPLITDPAVLDATTQPGYAGQPLIQLLGGSNAAVALEVTAGATTIRGFVISGFNEQIALHDKGGNHVEANYLCTDPTGMAAAGGNAGIEMFEADDSTIGGSTPSRRNLFAGCNIGLSIGTTARTKILGNYFGTDATGEGVLGIADAVELIQSPGTRVGSAAPGEGNVFAGATTDAILIMGGTDIAIRGNLIGTDATGTVARGNNFAIEVETFASDIRIGGSVPGEGNLISGNWIGAYITGATNVRILGNRMGTDFTGALPVPNRFAAIAVYSPSVTDIQIGGVHAGEGNLIAFNTGEGVAPGVMEGSGAIRNLGLGVTVRGNSMHSNGGYAIDNGDDGLSLNDPGDGDAGANLGQNFPIVHTVIFGASTTSIDGTLNSTPNTVFDLDFYADPECSPRPGGPLQGAVYLGSGQVTTDGSGTGTFSIVLPVALDPAHEIAATATDPAGNTSELSQRRVLHVSPGSGPAAGGTPITVTGTHFVSGAAVQMGGVAATDVVVSSENELTAVAPALPAGTIADVLVLNPDGTSGDLAPAWLADFADVPDAHQFYASITALVLNGLTAGCGGGSYCADAPVTRAQMAVFLLKGIHGVCVAPPPATGMVFTDVQPGDFAADWIEALAFEGITGGCGAGNYCPASPVGRDQMAVLLLKAKHGPSYAPPPCTPNYFIDVACPSLFADWIQQLVEEQISGGCGAATYCPDDPVTRGQMAAFLVKTFGLQ